MIRWLSISSLFMLSKVAVAFTVADSQNYTFMNELKSESKTVKNSQIVQGATQVESEVSHFSGKQNSMNIDKEEMQIISNGNINVSDGTKMQINPNGVNIKLQY